MLNVIYSTNTVCKIKKQIFLIYDLYVIKWMNEYVIAVLLQVATSLYILGHLLAGQSYS